MYVRFIAASAQSRGSSSGVVGPSPPMPPKIGPMPPNTGVPAEPVLAPPVAPRPPVPLSSGLPPGSAEHAKANTPLSVKVAHQRHRSVMAIVWPEPFGLSWRFRLLKAAD